MGKDPPTGPISRYNDGLNQLFTIFIPQAAIFFYIFWDGVAYRYHFYYTCSESRNYMWTCYTIYGGSMGPNLFYKSMNGGVSG